MAKAQTSGRGKASQVKQGRSKSGAFAPKAKVTSAGVPVNVKRSKAAKAKTGLKFTMRSGTGKAGTRVARSPGLAGVRDKAGKIVSNAKKPRAVGFKGRGNR